MIKEASKGVLWFWGILIVLAITGAASWGISVITSDTKGAGDAIIKNNSVENRTAAQARFENMYQDIVESDQKIGVYAEQLKANPDDRTLQTNLSGIQAVCISAVGDYNAEARKYLSADWKAFDLPDQINNLDPATDCK